MVTVRTAQTSAVLMSGAHPWLVPLGLYSADWCWCRLWRNPGSLLWTWMHRAGGACGPCLHAQIVNWRCTMRMFDSQLSYKQVIMDLMVHVLYALYYYDPYYYY